MKVKQILRTAATMLGLSDAVEYFDGKSTDGAGSVEAAELLRLYNEAEKDVAVNYIPVIYEEEVTSENGKIDTRKLSKTFLRAVYVLDGAGERTAFKVRAGYVRVGVKEAVIGYAYVPSDKQENGDCEYACGVPAKVFAMGVAAAYYLEKQLFEEAEIFKRQYDAALESAKRAFGYGIGEGREVKERKWV